MCRQLWSLSLDSALIRVAYVSLKRSHVRKLVFCAETLGGDK